MNERFGFFRNFCIVFIFLLVFSGCIGHITGTNVRQPKEGERGSYSQIFERDFLFCFEEVQKIITQDMRATIHYQNPKKGLISAMKFNSYYKNCNTTTEALISFKELESGKTKIIVASGNYGLAKVVAVKIFTSLEKIIPPKD